MSSEFGVKVISVDVVYIIASYPDSLWVRGKGHFRGRCRVSTLYTVTTLQAGASSTEGFPQVLELVGGVMCVLVSKSTYYTTKDGAYPVHLQTLEILLKLKL